MDLHWGLFIFEEGTMKALLILLFAVLAAGSAAYLNTPKTIAINGTETTAVEPERSLDAVRFRLVPDQSTFIVHANRAGIAYFKGKSHRIAVKDFDGEASDRKSVVLGK